MTLGEPYNPIHVHWFGEPWPRRDYRAPVCEDDRYEIPVPVGAVCIHCTELIDEGDRGVRMSGSVILGPDGQPMAGPIPYAHAECNLRAVTGNLIHVLGQCRHVGDCNERSDLTYRQEAQAVWEHYGTTA